MVSKIVSLSNKMLAIAIPTNPTPPQVQHGRHWRLQGDDLAYQRPQCSRLDQTWIILTDCVLAMLGGGSPSRWRCTSKLTELYREVCVKFNVCADPSTYGGHPLHTSAPPRLDHIASRPPSLYQRRVVQAKTRPRRSYTHGR